MLRGWSLFVVLLCLVLVSSCTGADVPPPPPTKPAPTEAPPTTAPPSPTRPVVELTFDVEEDLRLVTGRERVVFTPDLSVCELVFRAWPNKPATARTGNSLVVDAATIDGDVVEPRVLPAGAPSDGTTGTLITLPLPSCVRPGTKVNAELSFTLTLAPDTDERMGVAPEQDVAWFGSAFPLLAWERGRGWATEAAVGVAGEMATSEDFRLSSLRVTAPTGYQVMGTGSATGSTDSGAGTTVHEFSAPAVRDVSVTVGRLETLQLEVDGIHVHLASALTGTKVPLDHWAARVGSSIRGLTDLLGPFPYPDLWISVLPGVTDGVEFPGAIQFGNGAHTKQWLVTHEVAHMWFYGLVGNNQARDPWLDEAFATFAQRVVDGDQASSRDTEIAHALAGHVGESMGFWTQYERPSEAYVGAVYTAGGAALLKARRRSGPDAFDAALRDYVRDNAHQIAVPADVRSAFAGLPEALQVFEEAGALPRSPGS